MRPIFLLLLPLLIGCTNVQNKETNSANADSKDGLVTFHLNAPPATVKPLLLSELADSVSYVALETTKESLTDKAIQYGERYYTIINGDRLLCFDKNGKYLHQIGRRGKGPEEYTWMEYYNDFTVDSETNWVYCKSYNKRTQVYDENGKFVKSQMGGLWDYRPDFVYNHFVYFAPIYHPIIGVFDEQNNKSVTNNKEKIEIVGKFWDAVSEKCQKEGKRYSVPEGTEPVKTISNHALYCWCVFFDTVMMAKGKDVIPFCRIIPENKYLPEDTYSSDRKPWLLQPIIRRMYVCNDKILLYVRYNLSIEERTQYWVVCDLKDGNVTYHSDYIINDLDGGPNILGPNAYEEEIYSISVEDLKNDEEIYNSYFTEGVKAKLKDQEGKFQRLLESLADDANPIIRTFHWKK
ncbi:MAG: 6-bladed beta-propeller [Bacteroidales bacterium]|nr:6-bladed beta-propeller [Bacteroidales bacterium]